MTTKSIFDVPVQLTRAALLRLLKGESVETRNSPPGAAMIEGVAKVKLAQEITEEERRQLCDVLTRDVPEQYREGYAIASWGDCMPVVGSTAWLTMIAANADRISIRVQRSGAWVDVWLKDANAEEQKEAIRTWLVAGQTPEWRPYPDDGTQAAWRATREAADGSLPSPVAPITSFAPPVPPPPKFVAPEKTPMQEAQEQIGFIRWFTTESSKVGSPWEPNTREREFLKSCEAALRAGKMLSDKQRQWLADIYRTAKQKGGTIATLLPPTPKFV